MGHSCPRATRSPPDPLLHTRRRRKYQVSWWEDGQILSSQIFKGIANDSWGGKEELKCQKFWKQFCLRERWGDKLQHLVIKWRFSHEGFQGKQSWEKLLSWPSLSYKLTSFVFITTLTWLLELKLSEESLTTLTELDVLGPVTVLMTVRSRHSLLHVSHHFGKQISIADIDLQENKNHPEKHPGTGLLKLLFKKWKKLCKSSPHRRQTSNSLNPSHSSCSILGSLGCQESFI